MQKIYVLLRQDQQTGPYSLEEIIQFDLKPYDLVWIEGRSAGWYYPQEIAALQPYLAFLPKKQAPAADVRPQHVFITMPPAAQPTDMPAPPPVADVHLPADVAARPQRPVATAALEEAVYAQFRENKPSPPVEQAGMASATTGTRPKKPVNTLLVGVTTVLIVGGVFAASWMLNRGDQAAMQTLSDVVSNFPVQEEVQDTDAQTQGVASASAPTTEKRRNRTVLQPSASKTKSGVRVEKEPVTLSREPVPATDDIPTTLPPDGPPVTTGTEEKTEAEVSETTAPQEKKKKLRDKIFDIFRKKPAEAKQEESQPAENQAGERSASHRGESANLAQMVHVRFDVPNEWMMGIHGARATLVNRSGETVQKASIEVQYFDDDNQLLQKKILSFENVGGKGSKTVAIPDHATATKVDYSIVSVAGKPAA